MATAAAAASSSSPSPASESRSEAAPSSPNTSDDKAREPIAIPPIAPIESQHEAETLARGLEGCFVDEFGNVLGWDGTVLGRVRGDLPSMVGRPVSAKGQVLDVDGEVAGYVCENSVPPTSSAARKPLDRGLRVDDAGTIYDHEGVTVGRMVQQSKASPRPGESRRARPESGSSATPSPSEICLDVKSTHDGIQLIIKIPTVFHACASQPS